jgi:hypothetical protein
MAKLTIAIAALILVAGPPSASALVRSRPIHLQIETHPVPPPAPIVKRNSDCKQAGCTLKQK